MKSGEVKKKRPGTIGIILRLKRAGEIELGSHFVWSIIEEIQSMVVS